MTRKPFVFALIALLVLQLSVAVTTAQGPNLSFAFMDPVGDHTGEIDIVSMEFWFNNTTGDYEILLTANPAFPFSGYFRININLFNPDTGFGTQHDPSVFSDVFNDFDLSYSTTTITLSGTNSRLLFWEAGDRVATNSEPFGNPDGTTLFRSSVTNFPLEFLTNEDAIAYGNFSAEIAALVTPVTIDIKPGSDANSINCKNEAAVIAVAILTTDDFDATTVDHTTATFEGASETHVNKKTGEARRHQEDVDNDGDTDLVFHFRLGDTNLTCNVTEGTLTGNAFDGKVIEGTDAVRMIDAGHRKP